MTRDAPRFAALASAAVPGLSPIRAEAVRGRPGDCFEVGFVEDEEHRRWVVRLPVDAVAAARQDASVTLLTMLARRVPFSVPSPKGFVALPDGRRAMVYPLISGHALTLYTIPAGAGLAAEVGRAIAHLHNVDRRLFEEAAVPVYDAEECRRRHLLDVDRAAGTGLVPAGLLSRWERMLDDVTWWRFSPTPTHGRLDGPHLLAAFSSEADAASGRIRAIIGWENAKVGDPAEDFAALVASSAPETVDTVLEAYVMSRLENPDPHLEQRARLIAELRLASDLLAAVSAKDDAVTSAATQALRRLDADVGDSRTDDRPQPEGQAVTVVYERGPAPDRLYVAASPGRSTPDASGPAPSAVSVRDPEPTGTEPVSAQPVGTQPAGGESLATEPAADGVISSATAAPPSHAGRGPGSPRTVEFDDE